MLEGNIKGELRVRWRQMKRKDKTRREKDEHVDKHPHPLLAKIKGQHGTPGESRHQ